jgi:hypothetical protein
MIGDKEAFMIMREWNSFFLAIGLKRRMKKTKSQR